MRGWKAHRTGQGARLAEPRVLGGGGKGIATDVGHRRPVEPDRPDAAAQRARRIARDHGIRYACTGNTHDKDGQSTYCHGCGTRVIGRDWYQLSDWNVGDDGHCLDCGTRCAGVFAGQPGHWGRRRQPVWLAAAR